MKKALVLFSSAVLALVPAGPVLAQRSNLAPIPSYEVHRAKIAPRIDGKLDDAAWKAAKPVTFVFPWPDQTGKKQKTTARLLWDNDNLYVAYECEDSDVTAVYTRHDDPTYKDDAVEIFIAPPGVKNLYLGLEMNARGVLYDYLYPFPQRIMKNYNLPGVKLATSIRGTLNNSKDQDRGWSLEVAIPWSSFADLADNPVPQGRRPLDREHELLGWDRTQPPAFAMVGFGAGETGSALSGPLWPPGLCRIVEADQGCVSRRLKNPPKAPSQALFGGFHGFLACCSFQRRGCRCSFRLWLSDRGLEKRHNPVHVGAGPLLQLILGSADIDEAGDPLARFQAKPVLDHRMIGVPFGDPLGDKA